MIIDEAHNLLETISSIHNVSITGAQISLAHFQLFQVKILMDQRFFLRVSHARIHYYFAVPTQIFHSPFIKESAAHQTIVVFFILPAQGTWNLNEI